MLQNGELSFSSIPLPETFSQYHSIKGQKVSWGGSECIVACYHCDNALNVVYAMKDVDFFIFV